MRLATFALAALAACSDGPADSPLDRDAAPDALAALAADPPFEGTWWRLASLRTDAPSEGVRPVLIFTDEPALRDMYERPYPDSLHSWRIVTGEGGVGHLHAPYRRSGDTLRFAETYDYTRLSTDAEIAQARRLASALAATRTARQSGPRLVLLGASGDTLAAFTADPPRPPGPLDGTEWVLTHIGSASGGAQSAVPDGVRADLRFTSQRLGPGEDDGFDRFHGYTGCNWFGGGYRLAPDAPGRLGLTTNGPPMATQRGCAQPASGVEDLVLGALPRATSLVLSRDGAPDSREASALALHDSTGALLLSFRRHEPHAVDLEALRSARWRFASSDAPYLRGAEGAEVTFADSTFRASNGCRRTSGTWRVEGDDLWIQTETTDEPGCPPGEIRAIPIASGKLSVTADRLVLYDENGVATTFTPTSR